jgi:zinc finger SWIM domain-containing protein 3
MKKHLPSDALNEFRTLLYYTTTEAIFEERWRAFVQKWQTETTTKWMKRMYKRKNLWAAAYLADGYFLGMKSNQRSESLNSCLHLHLDFRMLLVDLIVHYETAVNRIRVDEAHFDCTDSQTIPVAVTKYRELEVSASHAFSAANFYILQMELKKIGGLHILDELIGDGNSKFVVAWKTNSEARFIVDYTPAASGDPKIECTCRRMSRKGLPCKHILFVLNHVGVSEIPKCCVLKRFSKHARFGLPARRESDLYAWGWSSTAQRTKFSQLSAVGAEAFHAACDDTESFNELMECMQRIIYKHKGTLGNGSDKSETYFHETA